MVGQTNDLSRAVMRSVSGEARDDVSSRGEASCTKAPSFASPSVPVNLDGILDEIVYNVTASDVVCGRGRGDHEKWPGTIIYRQLVDRYRADYNSRLSAKDRPRVIERIMQTIAMAGGRFVQKASDKLRGSKREKGEVGSRTSADVYIVIPNDKIRKKVSDDLRREIRRERVKIYQQVVADEESHPHNIMQRMKDKGDAKVASIGQMSSPSRRSNSSSNSKPSPSSTIASSPSRRSNASTPPRKRKVKARRDSGSPAQSPPTVKKITTFDFDPVAMDSSRSNKALPSTLIPPFQRKPTQGSQSPNSFGIHPSPMEQSIQARFAASMRQQSQYFGSMHMAQQQAMFQQQHHMQQQHMQMGSSIPAPQGGQFVYVPPNTTLVPVPAPTPAMAMMPQPHPPMPVGGQGSAGPPSANAPQIQYVPVPVPVPVPTMGGQSMPTTMMQAHHHQQQQQQQQQQLQNMTGMPMQLGAGSFSFPNGFMPNMSGAYMPSQGSASQSRPFSSK